MVAARFSVLVLAAALLLHSSNAGGADASSVDAIRGLDPNLAARYKPNAAGNFVCLDGSQEIPFALVNDDYCDCADGSDEPGTSACNNGVFYCANKGHVAARIPAAKVNDGVCDYECCDGSDEYSIECPNRCGEVGRRAHEEAERRTRTAMRGSSRRRELVREARGLRQAKQDELESKQRSLARAETEFAAAEERKNVLEARESAQVQAREGRRAALRDAHLPDLVAYRRVLGLELHRLRAHRDALVLLLRSVREGHNPEFNDAAVARLVAEYALFAESAPHVEAAALEHADEGSKARAEREARMDRDDAASDDSAFDACRTAVDLRVAERTTLADDIDVLGRMLVALRDDYNQNYHDLAVKAAVVGYAEFELDRARDLASISAQADEVGADGLSQRVADATAAIDAEETAPYEAAAIEEQGGEEDNDSSGDFAKELADARSAFWALQSEKNTLANDVSSLRELLYDRDLGPDDMYLPAMDQCVSLDAGEYTYEICLLDRATQISNKDNSRQNLGSFTGFDGADYAVQKYQNGAKCWNGPERSLTALFECGEETRILSIVEPEKCEYVAKMAGPFACAVLEEGGAESSDLLGDDEQKAVGEQPPIINRVEHDEL